MYDLTTCPLETNLSGLRIKDPPILKQFTVSQVSSLNGARALSRLNNTVKVI